MFNGCTSRNAKNLNTKTQIKLVIYPSSGSPSNTYYFVLNTKTGKMLVRCGTRSREEIDFNKGYFILSGRRFDLKYGSQKEKVYLSTDEVNKIIDLLNLIYTDESCINTGAIADTWGIAIYYNDTVVQNNSFKDSLKLKNLVDILRNNIDIDMELQGFA